jgi:hypothetical protein
MKNIVYRWGLLSLFAVCIMASGILSWKNANAYTHQQSLLENRLRIKLHLSFTQEQGSHSHYFRNAEERIWSLILAKEENKTESDSDEKELWSRFHANGAESSIVTKVCVTAFSSFHHFVRVVYPTEEEPLYIRFCSLII